MKGDAPEGVLERFMAALRAGDSQGAAACFAPDGCLLTADGTAVGGRRQIHDVLLQITASALVRFELARVVRVGSIALCSQRWTVTSRGAESEPFKREFSSTIVLGQGAQPGSWQVLIASPWGDGTR